MDRENALGLVDDLFREWASSLYRYAHRLTRSHPESDDLVQEAFFSLYRDLRNGVEIRSPRGWLLGFVNHQASKLRRDAQRWITDPEAMEAVPAAPRAEEERVTLDDVMALLDRLTIREREVLLLRLQSLKYNEIAEQLGISPKSVATFLARGISKMRRGAHDERGRRKPDAEIWMESDGPLQ